MKFKQYISESDKYGGNYRTKPIDKETAIKLIKDNCKKSYHIMYNSPYSRKLYRGVLSSKEYGFVDTNTGQPRISANTLNYMTLLMDNLPSWKEYPKRSKSIICSTNPDYTSEYGKVNHVIPYDNAVIGVCGYFDVWNSFTALGHNTVSDFNRALQSMFDREKIDVDDRSYDSLVDGLIKLSKISDTTKQSNLVSLIIDSDDVMKHLDEILDPKRNGFKMGYKGLEDDVEVWVQGKCVLVNNRLFDDMKESINEI